MPLSCNLGTLTFWNPLGHSRPVTGLIYLYTSSHTGINIRAGRFDRFLVVVWVCAPCGRWVCRYVRGMYCFCLQGHWFWFTWTLKYVGKKGICQLYGKVWGNLDNQGCGRQRSTMNALIGQISSNFPTKLTESFLPQPTSASRWTSINHSEDGSSTFLWKDEKLAYPKDDHQLIPLRYPVFTKCGSLLSSTTITNIIALILLYVTILQKCKITKSKDLSQSYVTLIALGIKTACMLSNIPNIKQFSIKCSCCHN